ncbi:MAG: prepilin-type N-terminal cleavage/methylation domain-containing protein [Burkholderiales bacterium]|nr:prepilin-type N-terminal cleavage/methylation domain-containing protein [Phycisphaerae bacterium]
MKFQFSIFNVQLDRKRQRSGIASPSIANRKSQFANPHRRAFTLTELLVAISVIILLLALALPAFNFMSGSNSVGAATNVVGATLSRARMDALAVQKRRGVVIYPQESTGRLTAAFIEEKQMDPWVSTKAYVVADYVRIGGDYYVCIAENIAKTPTAASNQDVWRKQDLAEVSYAESLKTCQLYDVVANSDRVLLSAGVDARGAGGDRKLVLRQAEYPIPAVIIFDGSGRVARPEYYLSKEGIIGTEMPARKYYASDRYMINVGQVGLVFFNSESLNNLVGELQLDTGADMTKANKERDWIAENARPVLVNRYNGTLIKGE